MKNNIIFICAILFNHSVFALPDAKITLKVVDETGAPVEGAKAEFSFSKPIKEGWGTTSNLETGLTDGEGLYTGVRWKLTPFVFIWNRLKDRLFMVRAPSNKPSPYKKHPDIIGFFRKWATPGQTPPGEKIRGLKKKKYHPNPPFCKAE